MSDLVLIATDLYFEPGARAHPPSVPGLEHLARFARSERLAHGWRAFLAGRLGDRALAAAAPAVIAATGLPGRESSELWLATPVHLTVSLASVHLHPHGLLRLDAQAQAQLAASFAGQFGERGYGLHPVSGGGFLLHGPPLEGRTVTTEPARCLGASIAAAQPQGPGARALKQLSAEIEMWLHRHELNAARVRAGELPVSALWLWGGGRAFDLRFAPEMPPPPVQLFGDDPYLVGLASRVGAACVPAPSSLADLSPRAHGTTTAVVVELFGEREPRLTTPQQALETLDREFIAPALAALARGELNSLRLLANDVSLSLRHRDRLRRWRRRRAVFEALG